jgi:hypothetical protein
MNNQDSMSASDLRRLANTAAAQLCDCSHQAINALRSLKNAVEHKSSVVGDQTEVFQLAITEMGRLRRYCDMAAIQLLARLPQPESGQVSAEQLSRVLGLCRSIQDQIETQQGVAARIVKVVQAANDQHQDLGDSAQCRQRH